MVQDFKDDLLHGLFAESLVEVGLRCRLAFADVEENIFNLEDVGEILLDFVAPLEDFVLVACDFEALLAFAILVQAQIKICRRNGHSPFFMRTNETLVSLI